MLSDHEAGTDNPVYINFEVFANNSNGKFQNGC